MNGIEQSSLWITGAVMLVAGIAVGLLVARRLLPGAQRARELEKELETARAEQTTYRKQVTEHFEKTGELFEEMAKGYRSVYDHLAQGAHNLCSEGMKTPRLDLPDKKLLAQEADPASTQVRTAPTTGPAPEQAPAAEKTAQKRPVTSASTPQPQAASGSPATDQPQAASAQGPAPEAADVSAPASEEIPKAKTGTSEVGKPETATEKATESESAKERPVVH